MRVQRLARDARLNGAIQILRADTQNAVHLRQIDRNPALQRAQLPLKRGARAKRDHRHARRMALAQDRGDLLGAVDMDHGVGRSRLVPCLAAAMLVAQRLRGGKTRSEFGRKGGEQCGGHASSAGPVATGVWVPCPHSDHDPS